MKPHPPMLRALKTAVEKLKAAGVKVVNWEPFDHQRGWDILVSPPPTHTSPPPSFPSPLTLS